MEPCSGKLGSGKLCPSKLFLGFVPLLLALLGCGYVGPVLPPSPQIPARISDLTVLERGDQLLVAFTTPTRTTDNLPVSDLSAIQVLVGETPQTFNESEWLKTAKVYSINPPETGSEPGQAIPVADSIPAAAWIGKRITVLARTAIKEKGRYSALSNQSSLQVVAPLAAPELSVAATAAGYQLSWKAYAPGVSFQILRKGPEDKTEVPLAVADSAPYTDATAIWDTAYVYRLVAVNGSAESPPSAPQSVQAADTFPPSVPTDLSAFESMDAVELSWRRSPELDTAAYDIYRSLDGGPYAKLDASTGAPAYTDRKVEHGRTYRYQVSAVDAKGNESAKSVPVELHLK